jgi:hypothetical protein
MSRRGVDQPDGSGGVTVPRKPVRPPLRPGVKPVGEMFRVPPKPKIEDDGRRYSYGGPRNIRPPEEYWAEAMRNAGLGQAPPSYNPFAALAGLFGRGGGGGGGGGGGRSRGGGGGGGSVVDKKAVNEAIKAMTDASIAAQGKIGGYFTGASTELGDMAARYAAAQQALGAGAGRTLGAFGVTDQQMNPLGMSAGDYLTSQQGLLTGLGAAQQAQLQAQQAAYALILGDLLKASK